MNYALFSYILNDNLVYDFSDQVSDETKEEYRQDWYADFKHTHYATDPELNEKQKVIGWMRHAFSEVSFDSHNFTLKPMPDISDLAWKKVSEFPPVPESWVYLWADFFVRPELRLWGRAEHRTDWSQMPHVYLPVPTPPKTSL